MKLENVTSWFQKNWKGVLITTGIVAVVIAIYLVYHKFFGTTKSTAPNVSNPNTDKVEMDRLTALYLNYKPVLSKDELYYKSLADSIQGYLQTNTFYFSSDLFESYFKDLDTAGFIAVNYFWGPSREFSGSVWNNPFQGLDDKYGNLIEALRARCYSSDFQKIQSKFQSTGLI